MSIFNVSIYIETTIKGPRAGMAAGAWLVEYITGKEVPETRSGFLWREETTENALTLELLAAAFSILTKTCSVRVNTQCEHVLNATEKKKDGPDERSWLERWKGNEWMNAKGLPVKNAGLWQQVSGQMSRHLVAFDFGDHPYRRVMQSEINRVLRKEKERGAGRSGGKERDGKHTNH